MQTQDDVYAFWNKDHPVFGGFRAIPYPTVLSQVHNLDEREFNTLPLQPPPKKKAPTATKKSSSAAPQPVASGSDTSTTTPRTSQLSDKALYIQSLQPDHTPEDPNTWCEIMKLSGTVRNNQIADGYCLWLNKTMTVAYMRLLMILFHFLKLV